jgi:hypothetical protein
MIDSVLLYGSGLLTLSGLAMLLRKRTRGAGTKVIIAGLVGMVAALFWPVSEKRATATTQLDNVMPVWEFDERHEIEIASTPERIFDAIHAVRADEIRFFQVLTTIRRGGRSTSENILNPSKNAPILDVALRGGFT